MTIRKKILWTCLSVVMFMSCQNEDEDFWYSTKDDVYFGYGELIGLNDDQKKNRWPSGVLLPEGGNYSFAITQKGIDTVYFPVSISGKRVSYDRKFRVVIGDSTSARPELHYEPLEEYYTMPADSGTTLLPIILYNKDIGLEATTQYLQLKLVATEDFETSLPKNLETALVSFSNRLERPNWWTNWETELGTYSRTKHALYLIALEGIEDKDLIPNYAGDNALLIPYNLYLIDKFRSLLLNPFIWTDSHPDYILEEKAEGVYDFYSVNNEFKKYKLSISDHDGKYYFRDDDGGLVSTDF